LGAKEELGIDKNYDRDVVEVGRPNFDYITKVGIGGPDAKWFKTSISNGPEARQKFQEQVLKHYDETYNPEKNDKSPFEEQWQYDEFLNAEKSLFAPVPPGGHKTPFIETLNSHGEQPTMIVKQMFKEQDLYNGCKDCIFDMSNTPYTRPEIPRPEGVPTVHVSQGLADNWRVSAKGLDRDPKKIDYIAMDNVATPESKQIFDKLSIAKGTDKTFARGTPEFDQIEASVQAKVIKRELTTEQETFGNKVVTEHRVFKDKDDFTWHMVSKLAEAPAA
jgi:hypothetical protein